MDTAAPPRGRESPWILAVLQGRHRLLMQPPGMWVEVKRVKGRVLAEMWKELFEAEGIPTRILSDGLEEGELSVYRVLVPHFREHVVEEVLRKI